ncbi:MAG: hypothetical protein M1832_005365 [Thelocarpon impressellum]|nr:MAG: hypothetical protein M1832_005365 [Thelocarpon impressellum]
MLPPTSLLPSAVLVASFLRLVSATPLPAPDKWDAQEDSRAICRWWQSGASSVDDVGRPQPMEFSVEMRGFGSREDRPGQGLLDNMRSLKRGSLHVESWTADFTNGTSSRAYFVIYPSAWVIKSVQGAIWDAAGGRAEAACDRA